MRIIVLLSLLLAGCTSQPVTAPEIYLLRSAATQMPQATALAPPQVGLSAVTVADYLDQPGLVLETESGTLHRARQHLWAEPLRTSLLRFMANEIGAALQAPVAVGPLAQELESGLSLISIRIDQLHGSNNGAAVLAANWEYTAPGGVIQSYRFTRQQALADDGYAALVAAEKSLLIQLAETIAAALEG